MAQFFKSILVALFCVSAIALCCGCSKSSARYYRNSGFVFGTQYNFTYRSDRDLSDYVLQRLRSYDSSLSVYNKHSLLYRLNESDSIVGDSDLVYVLNQAKFFNQLSGGAFDCTVEPLSRLWRFGEDADYDTIPVSLYDSLLVRAKSIRPLVGLDLVTIDGMVIRKAHPDMRINANALAEGYGIDCAAKVFEDMGVTDYMVEIGGEIHCKGLNPSGKAWRIGIDKPVSDGANVTRARQCVISVTNCAVSTSGNYRQCYYVADGRLLQHTIDPRTCAPVSHSMKSVTVVGPNTITTDALCTSIMVMGPDSVISMASKLPGVEAYAIYTDEDGNEAEVFSDGFKAFMH